MTDTSCTELTVNTLGKSHVLESVCFAGKSAPPSPHSPFPPERGTTEKDGSIISLCQLCTWISRAQFCQLPSDFFSGSQVVQVSSKCAKCDGNLPIVVKFFSALAHDLVLLFELILNVNILNTGYWRRKVCREGHLGLE